MADPFKDLPIVGLKNREQVINVMEARIDSFEEHLGSYPGPYDPLNGVVYILWERRAMLWLGRVSERLQVLQELSVLPPEQAARLKNRAMALINQATASVQLGTRQ